MAILGAILTFVPTVPQSTQPLHTDRSLLFYGSMAGGVSVTGGIPTTVSWSATESVQVFAYTEPGPGCSFGNSGNASDTNSSETLVPGSVSDSGTSGTLTIDQPVGGCIVPGVNLPSGGAPVNLTFTVTTALTTLGMILLIPGIALLLTGVFLRKGGKEPWVDLTVTESAPASQTPPPPKS